MTPLSRATHAAHTTPIRMNHLGVVDGVAAFEQRKLWVLNGSHSLMAHAGPLFGHPEVDEHSPLATDDRSRLCEKIGVDPAQHQRVTGQADEFEEVSE